MEHKMRVGSKTKNGGLVTWADENSFVEMVTDENGSVTYFVREIVDLKPAGPIVVEPKQEDAKDSEDN